MTAILAVWRIQFRRKLKNSYKNHFACTTTGRHSLSVRQAGVPDSEGAKDPLSGGPSGKGQIVHCLRRRLWYQGSCHGSYSGEKSICKSPYNCNVIPPASYLLHLGYVTGVCSPWVICMIPIWICLLTRTLQNKLLSPFEGRPPASCY